MNDDERIDAKQEIARHREALLRRLDERGWPWDGEAPLMLDVLSLMNTGPNETR